MTYLQDHAASLAKVLEDTAVVVKAETGSSLAVVYVKNSEGEMANDVHLETETLTDGSKVFNLVLTFEASGFPDDNRDYALEALTELRKAQRAYERVRHGRKPADRTDAQHGRMLVETYDDLTAAEREADALLEAYAEGRRMEAVRKAAG